MTTITVSYSKADMHAFAEAHFSAFAWKALVDIRNAVRSQIRNGDHESDRAMLEAVQDIISDVMWRVEE